MPAPADSPAELACAQHGGPGYATRPDGQVDACAVHPFDTTYHGAATRHFWRTSGSSW